MNTAFIAGFAGGILGVAIITLIMTKILKRKCLFTDEFDERQELIRGRAYKYAFFTLLICDCIALFLSEFFTPFPLSTSLLMFVCALISIDVYAVYCIVNDAYFGIGTNIKRYFLLLLIIQALNLAGSISTLSKVMNGTMDFTAPLQFGDWANFGVVVLFIPIIITMVMKMLEGKKEADDEES